MKSMNKDKATKYQSYIQKIMNLSSNKKVQKMINRLEAKNVNKKYNQNHWDDLVL